MSDVGDLYGWLVFLHVLAATIWIGGVAMLTAFGLRVMRVRDDVFTRRFLESLRVVGPALLAPAPLVLLALGAGMVADSPAWSWDQDWIRIGTALFAAIFLVGVAHQAPVGVAAARAAERGEMPEALRRLRRWAYGMAAILALLAAAVWDMTFKPGL